MTKEAFIEQVTALTNMLYRVSYGLLANPEDQADAVQESIRKALCKRESLRDDQFFRTWLVRILINECRNIQRRGGREIPAEEIVLAAPPEANRELYEALMALPDKYRLPVMLHYIEGYAVMEIARMLRVPEGTVKTRLRKARGLLKALLQDEEEGCAYEKA